MVNKNPILNSISKWFQRIFADPNTVSLFMTVVLGIVILELFGRILLPVLISLVIAYLLFPFVRLLTRWKLPYLVSVIIVWALFMGLVVFFAIDIIPLLWKQLVNLVGELPKAFDHSQLWYNSLSSRYPTVFSETQLQRILAFTQDQSSKWGQDILRYTFSSIPGVFEVILYLVLVPLLVFFFLKDATRIMKWVGQYMPAHRGLTLRVWGEVRQKIGAYIQGRVIEMIIVGVITTLTFLIFGLPYAILLGSLVGVSVLIPYVGGIIVTIPIVIIALMQWGFGAEFIYAMIAFGIIFALDANLLVPLLFSESMELHPIVILVSVIFFGGIWGFWGIFFAIPLAMAINVILKNWPKGVARHSPSSLSS